MASGIATYYYLCWCKRRGMWSVKSSSSSRQRTGIRSDSDPGGDLSALQWTLSTLQTPTADADYGRSRDKNEI